MDTNISNCTILCILILFLSSCSTSQNRDDFANNAHLEKQLVALSGIDKIIPKGWVVKSVTNVDAPYRWKRESGKSGIMVILENPTTEITHGMTGDKYHPYYEFSLMPLCWQGRSSTDYQFKDGQVKYVGLVPAPARQDYPHRFVQVVGDLYYLV